MALLVLVMTGCQAEKAAQPSPGVFRLSFIDGSEVYELTGQWRFSWMGTEPFQFVHVPEYWTYKLKLPNLGEAFYEAEILLPERELELALDLGAVQTSYEVFWNGELVGSQGNVHDRSEAGARVQKQTLYFKGKGISKLRIHVANWFNIIGGFGEPIYLGAPAGTVLPRRTLSYIEIVSAAILLFLGLYFGYYTLLSSGDRSHLYLTAVIFSSLIRVLILGQRWILNIFPALSMGFLTRLEYITIISVASFFLLYFHSLKEKSSLPWYVKIFLGISVLYALALPFVPFQLYIVLFRGHVILSLVVLVLMLGELLLFSKIPKTYLWIFRISLFLLIGAGVHDLLQGLRIIENTFIFAYATVIYLFFQVWLLNQKRLVTITSIKETRFAVDRAMSERSFLLKELAPHLKTILESVLEESSHFRLSRQADLSAYGLSRLQYLFHFFSRWINQGGEILWGELEEFLKNVPLPKDSTLKEAEARPGPRILVVDDEGVNRLLLTRQLQKQGAVVEAVEDALAALEKLSSCTYDVLLLDIMMSPMTGYEMVVEAKRRGIKLPLLFFLTAKSGREEVLHALSMGAVGFHTKPFSIRVFYPSLLNILSLIGASNSGAREKPRPFSLYFQRSDGSFLPDDAEVLRLLAPAFEWSGLQLARAQSGELEAVATITGLIHLTLALLLTLEGVNAHLQASVGSRRTCPGASENGLVLHRESFEGKVPHLSPVVRVSECGDDWLHFSWDRYIPPV